MVNTQPSAAPRNGRRSLVHKVCTKRMDRTVFFPPYAFRGCAACDRGVYPSGCCAKGTTMSATRLPYPLWQGPLLQAVMETGSESLLRKIQIAEKAISQRLRELAGDPGSKEERIALHDAVSTLRALKSALIQSDGPEN